MNAFLANLKQLGLTRIAALGGVGVATLVLLGVLILRGADTSNGLLYRDLDPREAGEITEQLAKSHIAYRLSDGGATIMVPESDIARSRLLLAKNGLPSGGSVGYEIFDKGNGFTATQFEQTINETRALEGELERSIRLIHGVRSARVHLVLRHRELFSSDEQEAQASVLLSMEGRRRLDDENVAAIVNLVSAAVPGLQPRNISLIDDSGHVLLKQGTGRLDGTDDPQAQRREAEERITREVEDLLGASIGVGHVRVEATVAMNEDQVRETQESYDPEQQVLRSQQTKSEKSVNTQGTTNTSVANNLPNANAGQPQSGSQSNRQEQTDNYEIGKTIRTVVQSQPRVARLSVAVIVDGLTAKDAKGQPVWHPRGQEELDRLTDLTKSAIGFDKSRGDTVTVMSMQFTDLEALSSNSADNFLSKVVAPGARMEVIRLGVFIVCLLLVMFFVVRPLLRSPSPEPVALNAQLASSASGGLIGTEGGSMMIANNGSAGLLAAPANGVSDADSDEEETVEMSGIKGKIRASSVQRVVELVQAHPVESIALLRGWLTPQREGL